MQFNIECKRLMEAMKAIMIACDEAILTIGPEGVKTTLVDPANVCMVAVEVPMKINVEKEFDIGMSFDRLKLLLEIGSLTGDLTFKMDEAAYLNPENKEKPRLYIYGYDTSITVPLLDPGSIRKRPRVPPLESGFTAKFAAKDFLRAIKMANTISDHVRIVAALDGVGFCAEGCDGYQMEKWIKKGVKSESVYVTAPKSPEKSLYSIEYMLDIAKRLASPELIMDFRSDYPVKITNTRDDLRITVLLAPRIESF